MNMQLRAYKILIFMKNFFLIFMFSCTVSKAIRIDGLKSKYNINQDLEFSVINNSDEKYYYVGLECFDNNMWIEIINDITNPLSRMSLIKNLKPNIKQSEKLPLRNIFILENFLTFKKYRLKMVYGKFLNEINSNFYSESFEIVEDKWQKLNDTQFMRI
jgi:hypothetical protein